MIPPLIHMMWRENITVTTWEQSSHILLKLLIKLVLSCRFHKKTPGCAFRVTENVLMFMQCFPMLVLPIIIEITGHTGEHRKLFCGWLIVFSCAPHGFLCAPEMSPYKLCALECSLKIKVLLKTGWGFPGGLDWYIILIFQHQIIYYLCVLLKDPTEPTAVSCVVPLFQVSPVYGLFSRLLTRKKCHCFWWTPFLGSSEFKTKTELLGESLQKLPGDSFKELTTHKSFINVWVVHFMCWLNVQITLWVFSLSHTYEYAPDMNVI